MIKFDKNEFLKPQIYSTLNEYETRCNVTKEIIEEIEQLQQENKKQKEVINKAIDFIENGDLLYLANKNSIVYRNNIEVRAVADRLNDLLQILEDKEVSE